MSKRVEFHEILVGLLGSRYVYFQPPSTIKMNYPCIVYSLSNMDRKFADDQLYLDKDCYSVSVIDADPDSLTPKKIGRLPYSSFSTFFVVDNLNHTVFSVYY